MERNRLQRAESEEEEVLEEDRLRGEPGLLISHSRTVAMASDGSGVRALRRGSGVGGRQGVLGGFFDAGPG